MRASVVVSFVYRAVSGVRIYYEPSRKGSSFELLELVTTYHPSTPHDASSTSPRDV